MNSLGYNNYFVISSSPLLLFCLSSLHLLHKIYLLFFQSIYSKRKAKNSMHRYGVYNVEQMKRKNANMYSSSGLTSIRIVTTTHPARVSWFNNNPIVRQYPHTPLVSFNVKISTRIFYEIVISISFCWEIGRTIQNKKKKDHR